MANQTKIPVTYGEAKELFEVTRFKNFYPIFKKIAPNPNKNLYFIKTDFDFDNSLLINILSKYKEVIISLKTIQIVINDKKEPNQSLNNDLTKKFDKLINENKPAEIIKSFIVHSTLYCKKSQIPKGYNSFFMWINYLEIIWKESILLMYKEAFNNDVAYKALFETMCNFDEMAIDYYFDLVISRFPDEKNIMDFNTKSKLIQINDNFGLGLKDIEYEWIAKGFKKALKSYKPDKSKLKTWISKCIRNEIYQKWNSINEENKNHNIIYIDQDNNIDTGDGQKSNELDKQIAKDYIRKYNQTNIYFIAKERLINMFPDFCIDEIEQKINELLKISKKQNKLTQKDIAKLFNVSNRTIRNKLKK